MSLWLALVRRDVRLAWNGGLWLPVVFFMLVAILYPFGVGPDAKLLARTGGGVLWVAALLAALLPVDRLIQPDAESGVLDQLAVRGISDEGVASAKLVAHWLSFAPPLMLAAIPAAALVRIDGETLWRLEAGLALGTPALAALGLLVARLTAGPARGGAFGGLGDAAAGGAGAALWRRRRDGGQWCRHEVARSLIPVHRSAHALCSGGGDPGDAALGFTTSATSRRRVAPTTDAPSLLPARAAFRAAMSSAPAKPRPS